MIPIDNAGQYRKLIIEKILLSTAFPFLNCRIKGPKLLCRGRLQPTKFSPRYRVELEYSAWSPPDVRVVEPTIQYTRGIHMYKNGTLCLYDWRAQPWQKTSHLHDTVIPWMAEWLVFYELWLLTGKWNGKSAPHGSSPVAQN
jgi:hypothetical protein